MSVSPSLICCSTCKNLADNDEVGGADGQAGFLYSIKRGEEEHADMCGKGL